MLSNNINNAIVIDSDDDCKPAALPTSPQKSKKRNRSGVLYDDTSGEHRQADPEVIVLDTSTIARRKSARNQDIIVLDSSDSDEAYRIPPSKRRKRPSGGSIHDDIDIPAEDSVQVILDPTIPQQENQVEKANSKKEHEEMTKSSYGKAVLVVQEILKLTKTYQEKYPNFAHNIGYVSTDDMVFLAKNLLEKQAGFLGSGCSAFVDIGYHYTNDANLSSIRTNGLMTKNERDAQGVKPHKFNGSAYGDGVYTANNQISFSKYGDSGLIVGRLLGVMKDYEPGQTNIANTILVPNVGIVVLKTSAQCLPMIKYDTTLVASKEARQIIRKLQKSLQKILDQFFNPGLTAPPTFWNAKTTAATNVGGGNMKAPPASQAAHIVHPKQKASSTAAIMPATRFLATGSSSMNNANSIITRSKTKSASAVAKMPATSSLSTGSPSTNVAVSVTTRSKTNLHSRQQTRLKQAVLQYAAPVRLSGAINPNEAFCPPPASCNFQNDCAICQDALSIPRPCVALKVCNHVFHKDCIEQACRFGSKCPTCRKSIGTPLGKSPSGSMTSSVTVGLNCGGFPTWDTITIVYSIQSGIQKDYHENPGQPHPGKKVIAFLPSNSDGKKLLKRLKFAFLHGLTFTVGTSMTTGAANQCTWSSIHHKTSSKGGAHGFPDPNFFANCNGELDNANVPAANLLDVNGQKLVPVQH
ncbi:MAG: hypothetical protein SGBAC_001925 [Bacillariaceae sp.]